MIVIVKNGVAIATHSNEQYDQIKSSYPSANHYICSDGSLPYLGLYDDEGNETAAPYTEAQVQAVSQIVKSLSIATTLDADILTVLTANDFLEITISITKGASIMYVTAIVYKSSLGTRVTIASRLGDHLDIDLDIVSENLNVRNNELESIDLKVLKI